MDVGRGARVTCTTCDGTGETETTNEFGHVLGYGPCGICDGRGIE
jgi:DnaJ-class molecular chaperone